MYQITFNGSCNSSLSKEKDFVLSKWTVADGLILLIVLFIWLITFCSFMKKWGNFRVPLPRDIIRKFKPMNVDQVKVIDQKKENCSVIFKTYGKQIQDTMHDRQRRLKINRNELKASNVNILGADVSSSRDVSNNAQSNDTDSRSLLKETRASMTINDSLDSRPSLFS